MVLPHFEFSRGQWNVPYVTEVALIHGYLIPKLRGGYKDGDLDADMALCKRAREKVGHGLNITRKLSFSLPFGLGGTATAFNHLSVASFALQGIFMYVDNQRYYGHLVVSENFETTHKHNDLFALLDNRYVSSFERKCQIIFVFLCRADESRA